MKGPGPENGNVLIRQLLRLKLNSLRRAAALKGSLERGEAFQLSASVNHDHTTQLHPLTELVGPTGSTAITLCFIRLPSGGVANSRLGSSNAPVPLGSRYSPVHPGPWTGVKRGVPGGPRFIPALTRFTPVLGPVRHGSPRSMPAEPR